MKILNQFLICFTISLSILLHSSDHKNLHATKQESIVQIKQCGICQDEKNIIDFCKLHCGHDYCKDCLQTMIDMAIREKSSEALKCPHPNCAEKFTEQDIKTISNNQNTVDALAEIMTMEFLAKHPHAKQCPTPNCPYVFINNATCPQAINCPACHQEYCSNCLFKHDPKTTCAQAKAALPADRATTDFMQQQHIKPCPQCGVNIERISGCPFVTCKKCQYGFCFNCYGTHHVGVCTEPEVHPYAHGDQRVPKIQEAKQAVPLQLPNQIQRAQPAQPIEAPEAQNAELRAEIPQAHIFSWEPILHNQYLYGMDKRGPHKPIRITIEFNQRELFYTKFVHHFFKFLKANHRVLQEIKPERRNTNTMRWTFIANGRDLTRQDMERWIAETNVIMQRRNQEYRV